MVTLFKYILWTLWGLFLLIIIGVLAPQQIKEPIPRVWGMLEGVTGWDMTGFWFSSWHGHGSCRIVNSREAFRRPGSKIIFGMVTQSPGAKPYPHLWATAGQDIIDSVCPPTLPACSNRKIFAVIDSSSLVILQNSSSNGQEKHQIEWGVNYLRGLKAVGEKFKRS